MMKINDLANKKTDMQPGTLRTLSAEECQLVVGGSTHYRDCTRFSTHQEVLQPKSQSKAPVFDPHDCARLVLDLDPTT